MNNNELDMLLKSVGEPSRPADYWESFPDKVMSNLARPPQTQRAVARSGQPRPIARLAWFTGGMIAACLILTFVFTWSRQKGDVDFTAADLAVIRRYLEEVEALFPNQIQAVVFENNNSRLILADRASVATKLPVFVRICSTDGCQSFLTFSGQQIQLYGETIDVLVDSHGNVLLVGTQLSWTSGNRNPRVGVLSIYARPLESAS